MCPVRRNAWFLFLAAFSATGGCKRPPPPESTDSTSNSPSPSAAGAEARPRVTLDLKNASVTDVATALAQRTGRPLVIDAEVQPFADCVRITLLVPEPVPPASLVPLVDGALTPSGLALSEQPTGFVVRRRPGAPLASCPEPRHAAEASAEANAELPLGPAARAPDGADARAIVAGIRKTGEGRFEVSKRTRDLLAANASLLTSARFVPAVRDGKAVGMRLFGIRPGTPVAALGFQNGDTLLTVAGQSITGPEQALEAYAKVRRDDSVDVQIERRGEPLTLSYRFTP